MAKLDLVDLVSLANEPSAIQSLNYNFQLIASAFDNTLSRDGTTPNQMEANLDLNSKRLLNLAAPSGPSDPARLQDIQEALVVDEALIPALQPGKVLSNDGTMLLWQDGADISGLGDMRSENNLSDVADISTARTNLGLTVSATTPQGTSGAVYGRLADNLTFSGDNSFTGTSAFSGAATFSGTGNHRLTATPTTLTSDSIGYRNAPPRTLDSNSSFALLDSGGSVIHTSATAHAWTIAPQSSVAWPDTTVILLVNLGSGAVTLTRGSGVTLRIAGTPTNKNVTLAQHGIATLIRPSANTWYVSGTGLS